MHVDGVPFLTVAREPAVLTHGYQRRHPRIVNTSIYAYAGKDKLILGDFTLQ